MPHDDQKIEISSPKTGKLVKRLVREYLRPYVRQLLLAFLFMALAAAMTAAVAQLMQPVLDDVLNKNGDETRIWSVAIGVFCVFLVRGAATYVHVIIMNKVGQSIVADIQHALFGKFMRMDLSFFHANPSGQLISRVTNDVNVMRMAVSDSLTGLGKSLLTLIFLIAVMFYQDWKLSIAAFIIFPFAAGFVAYLGRRLRQVSGAVQDEMAGLSGVLSQIFQGIRQVKAYGMEQHETQKTGQAIDKVKRLNIKSVRVGNLSTPVNEILVGLVLMGVIGYGGMQVSSGAMSPGQLGAFLAAFMLAYEPMKKLAKLNNALQVGLGAAERVFNLMDRDVTITDKQSAQDFHTTSPEIKFKNVQFKYEKSDVNALNKINILIKKGAVTALVGPSGGGKSTIMNMIPRFYDVSDGAIEIDGVDLRDMTMASLRSHIALVSQDITIFDDTVTSNIKYSKPSATDDEVVEAAKMAFAHEFIEDMSEGYETVLGEDGVRLSGGQKQRIAIARAILRDAPILLLDEATSALDNESEQAVQKALKKLEKGRTTLVIAHRLSTVQNADQIIVLSNGEVVETGKHDALIKKDGLYAQMYQAGL